MKFHSRFTRWLESGSKAELWLSRRPLLSTFVVALAARMLVAVCVRVYFGGNLFLDDKSYLRAVDEAVLSGKWSEQTLWDSTPSLFRPLVVANHFLLRDALVSQTMVAITGSITAVLVALTIKQLGKRTLTTLRAGLVVAIFPSQILWSSIVLKDALVWLAIAGVGYSLTNLFATGPVRRKLGKHPILGLFGILAAITVAYGARPHAALLLAAATTIATITSILPLRFSLPVLVLPAFAVPALLGFGPFASRILENGSRSFAENRGAEVSQAETPLECWDIPFFGEGDPAGGGWRNDILCLPSSMSMALTMPWPTQVADNPSLLLPLLELPAWLSLYLLALRSTKNYRGGSAVKTFAIIHVGTTILFWSSVDRVVGTAFRHRSELAVGLLFLAAHTISPRQHEKQ